MMNDDVNTMNYEEAVFYAWERKFNHTKWSKTFFAIVIVGGLITMLSIIYTMIAIDPAEPTNAGALVYGLGAMGIVAVGMSLLGSYVLLLNQDALVTALKVAKEGFADNMVSETLEPTSKEGVDA